MRARTAAIVTFGVMGGACAAFSASVSPDAGGADAAPAPMPVATRFASGQLSPSGIASDGTYIYWTNAGGGPVLRCPLDGCADGGPEVVARDQANAGPMVVGTFGVGWATPPDLDVLRPSDVGDAAAIGRCAHGLAGTSAMRLEGDMVVAFDSTRVAKCVVVDCFIGGYSCGPLWDGIDARIGDTDGDRVYVATGTDIRSCALGGGCSTADAGTVVVPAQASVRALALGPASAGGGARVLYWVDDDGGKVMSAPTTGDPRPTTTLATGLNTASRIAVDGLHLYILNAGTSTDGELVRIDTTDGGLTVLASGLVGPVDLLVGTTDVYWTNAGGSRGSGTVMRVAK